MEKFLDFIVRAGSLDRRYIFVVIALVVMLPLFFPLNLPIRPTVSSQTIYDLNMVLALNLKFIPWQLPCSDTYLRRM